MEVNFKANFAGTLGKRWSIQGDEAEEKQRSSEEEEPEEMQ